MTGLVDDVSAAMGSTENKTGKVRGRVWLKGERSLG